MNAANQVFSVPELLEYILLSLPSSNTHQEIIAMRTIILAQTTCRTWHSLIQHSTPVQKALYLPTPADIHESPSAWNTKHAFPPARPNTWIPFLLLEQRSWGSAYPFDNELYTQYGLQPSQPRYWTFSLEISRRQLDRLPRNNGSWRSMLASSPPFTEFWYTRSFYELGSGRAPFVTHIDYDSSKAKGEQRYVRKRPEGVTLGDLVDAVVELFEVGGGETKFVMVESVRRLKGDGEGNEGLRNDRPTTRSWIPGLSAEKAYGWQREL